MIQDGVPYKDIKEQLGEHGAALTEDNISEWKTRGGYETWVAEQFYLDEMRARLDFASELVNKHNSQLLDQASLRIAILRLFNLLSDFDPAVLKPKMADHPGTYTRLLNALCKLTEGDLKFERHRLNQDRLYPLDH
jgi:hypothetical protein